MQYGYRRFWLRMARKLAKTNLHGWALVLIGTAIFAAPVIAPHDPNATDVSNRLKPPCLEYPCGTDDLGRCVLSRVIYGGRISLGMCVAIMALSIAAGGLLGLTAGYAGGWPHELLMRLTDVFMAIPSLVMALVLVRSAGPSVLNMVWVVAIGMWPGVARMVCGLVMQVKKEHYIQTAVMTGLGTGYIFRRHIVPAILPPLLVMATLGMGRIILMTSALGFLGLGIVEPTPEWGAMLNNGTAYIRTAPHLALVPGLLISVTVLSFNLLGEGIGVKSKSHVPSTKMKNTMGGR